ncbi:hypothetical protein Kfla_4032 [Kribbella flavida DSM 17836]|uniref:Uncharacterized protein n=1 Tax=Kribbella flavida (strain DSM 17836 / JCM 10339 / NBRC 14399) TaxID=479435 RepID=D2PSE3_KRIFD|nr:hypothetical protein [Kribbella flavida]ADB33081.1 hypothetical protein Kfla_4032 [Kribbella flavida DSM 17836]
MNARNRAARTRRLPATIASALLVTATLTGGATAAGAHEGKQAGRFCVVEVGKSVDGGFSPVKSQTCSDDPASSVFRAAAAPDVLLMEWFWNAYNNPPKITRIIVSASDGPCDSSGYRLRPNLIWDNEISGFNAYSQCHRVTLYDGYSSNGDSAYWFDGTHDGPKVGYVGAHMNDRTSSIWIRY